MRLMGVERAIRIGGIERPALGRPVCHDVDHATQCVCAEANRHHPLIDLDAFRIVDGNVIQAKGLSHPLLRNPVNKDLHMLPCESIQHHR